MQAAPYAVDKLEELMQFAESEPVMLKAATEILDRAGVRGGIEIDTSIQMDLRPAADVIAERLARITAGAVATAARLNELIQEDVIDAEEVKEEEEDAVSVSTSDEESKDQPAASPSDQK